MSDRTGRAIIAVAAAIIAILFLIGIIYSGDDPTPKATTTQKDSSPAIPDVIKVDGVDADTKKDDAVVLSDQAADVAQDIVDDPGDLKAKPGAPPLAGNGDQKKVGVVPGPLATQSIPGCRTRFLTTNFSSRGVSLSEVRLFELHYTAGRDVPNSRADVDGLTAFGNRPPSRVSWQFNMDKDGNCDYNVPLTQKAWTIANLNPYTINIEVAGSGEEPYLRDGGYRQLARIMKAVQQSGFNIPVRLGASSNCKPTKSGMDSHYRGGPCSGGHVDIKPIDLAKVINKLQTYMTDGKPDTSEEKNACSSLKYHRSRVRAGASWQDRIRNQKGHMVLRYKHANAKKKFLVTRKVRERIYCR